MKGSSKAPRDDATTALAISYILGLLPEEEMAALDIRLAADAEFRQRVTSLEDWLAPINTPAAQLPPSAKLFERILEDLDLNDTDARLRLEGSSGYNQTRPIPPARRSELNDLDPYSDMRGEGGGPLRDAVTFWRRATAASVVGLVLALSGWMWTASGLSQSSDATETSEPLGVAALHNAGEAHLVLAVFRREAGELEAIVDVAALRDVLPADVPDADELVLWALIGDSNPIYLDSLGPVRTLRDRVRIDLTRSDVSLAEDGRITLAISVEPPAVGSTPRAPKGPVILTGELASF